ncbi:glutathione-independent formaldehyde dehydrogenase [Methanocella arvoryzae]|uniref:NAD-dependent formaldehyde dehydrogenase n=1 Tax=Methanocella arvoryzae (strain DSM 22066 / NBRC 105507 / MRE50) TaxID=351160 RepID=Q0W2K1_METAR|nr:glutathione-independent formaldehyde dehydrogenase [Methanocella arvoryzae]CAJ37392.1 NAD-dependent formaldehyde dehydrogenase [Methanocella arvoryzae MRE50]
MEAVVYTGPGSVAVKDIPRPQIEHPTDVILRLTSSAICGSDLHMYDGHTDAQPGLVFGHEPMGIVEEVGDAVRLVKEGDRVVVPFNIACGVCFNCERGFTNACLTMNAANPGGAYGYTHMGPYLGAQAEFTRVPHADWACLKLPGRPGDSNEDNFLMLADVFPTAYYATELAQVAPGKTTAVFGAGPVGLLCVHSALMRGAPIVYLVDKDKRRLEMGLSLGAIPINFLDGDPVVQIQEHLKTMRPLHDAMRYGEDKMLRGVDCVIDAVGYQAYDRQNPDQFKPNQVLLDIARVANYTATVGIIGVYTMSDPRGKTEAEKNGMIMMPWGLMWEKGLQIGTGQTPVKRFQAFLRDQIIAGKASPGSIVTDHIKIGDAPETYKEFDKRGSEVVKAVIRFI